jgi:uncharacterized membrane protein YozB (DUF420 family)
MFNPILAIFTAHPLVHINATLNSIAAVLLILGYVLIRNGRIEAHKRVMLSAFLVSTVFLGCYLWYHKQVGHVEFTQSGVVRYVYYAVLFSHIPLAMTVPILATAQIYLGFRALGCCAKSADPSNPVTERTLAAYRDKHIRLSRWTLPIWMYVSISGVVVYLMLYHLWPPIDR